MLKCVKVDSIYNPLPISFMTTMFLKPHVTPVVEQGELDDMKRCCGRERKRQKLSGFLTNLHELIQSVIL